MTKVTKNGQTVETNVFDGGGLDRRKDRVDRRKQTQRHGWCNCC